MKWHGILGVVLALSYVTELCAEGESPEPDIEHGNRQVRQMLADRPAMATYETAQGDIKKVTEDDTIWKWAAKSYGTKINGRIVEWSNEPPGDLPFRANHTSPTVRSKGKIRVRKKWVENGEAVRDANFHELWRPAVFELFNIKSTTDFLMLWDRKNRNEISQEDYVRELSKVEHRAILKTKEFYHEIWFPWKMEHSVIDHTKYWRNWRNAHPDEFLEWQKIFDPDGPYITYLQDGFDRKPAAEPEIRFTEEENARFEAQLRISKIVDPDEIKQKRRVFEIQLRQWEVEDAKKRKWAEELRLWQIEDAKRRKKLEDSGVPKE